MHKSKQFVPLYEKTEEKIIRHILQNDLQDGDFLGTLLDLRKRYDISGNTARQAVAGLEAKGILRCKSAVGVYVKNRGILNVLNTFKRVILVIHHHYQNHLKFFFEMRLNSLLQNFLLHGYACLPIYREELESERIRIMAPQICGIVTGSQLYPEVRKSFPDQIPLLRINPPRNVELSPEDCVVRYDFELQNRLALQFFKMQNRSGVVKIRTDSAYKFQLPEGFEEIEVTKKQLYPQALQTGIRLGEELYRTRRESSFWITDDFAAFGFWQTFLRHGIDLLEEKRLLAFGAPSLQLTMDMQLPVIGFCPMKIGLLAAEKFCSVLDAGEKKGPVSPAVIPPACNPAASAVLKKR